jgi:replicative DNA helicase
MVAQRAPLEAVRSPNRIPPHNLDAEQSVLGAMLESREAIANVIEIVKPDDFYKPAHTEIYDTILTLHSQGEAVDAITVADELSRRGTLQEIGGKPYIHGLLEAYPTATAAGHYARIVDELAILRRLVDAGNRVQEIGFSMPEDVSSAVDEAEGIIYDVGDRRLKDDYLPIRQLLTENMEMIETLYERGENVTGLATGFSDLDDMTSGFQPSNLIIVAARPSMGKCLAASTLIDDPQTGERLTIQQFVARTRPSIWGIGTRGEIRETEVADWVPNGVKPCYQLKTRLGRAIDATGNHPFLTVDGWVPLGDLKIGRKIAVPRTAAAPGSDSLNPNRGHLPKEVWRHVRKALNAKGMSLGELGRRAGEKGWTNLHADRGLPQRRLRVYAEILDDEDLRWLASDDLYWDEIVSIEAIGPRPVYDLTVPAGSNFIAQGFCVHNSSLLNDFALHSALKQRQPVVVFSLEMSRHEVVQRMLASEARVDMQRIKKGSLQEQDWTRLSAALGRLAEAPVFIDDSANVTLMEMRAKCRRLKGRHGLGLVVIDYLQLMQSPKKSENRQQEVSEISRALKIMAKDLDVPVVCASQLNRGVEYRSDKRPLLGDLRESGCLTGDTLVALASGKRAPISSLVGDRPEVVTLDGWHMQTRRASKVWRTGRKQVYKLTTATGRTVRATANHPFRTLHGWTSLEDLSKGSRIGVARAYPETILPGELDARHLVLLGHLIGDGSFLRNLPLRYASQSEANIAAVVDAAKAFGVEARVKFEPAARCTYVFLPAPYHLTHGRRNPIVEWLDGLGLYDKRSHEKFVPEFVFSRSRAEIGLFLRHLWATDGCVWLSRNGRGPKVVIYYGTNSRRLAHDVQHLMARLGIISRIKATQKGNHRPGYNVTVTGSADQLRFALIVGGHGERSLAVSEALKLLQETKANTNRDTIPVEIWDLVKSRMRERGITHRAMAAMRNSTYGGTSHFRFAPSRSLLNQYAELIEDVELKEIANSDVFWDTVVSIEPDGVEDVYDMTVSTTHNFVANGLILHNSIEQDSDLVMFIYRDEVYNPDSEQKGEAELIVAKHRNGPTGLMRLAFMNQYTKFANIARGPGF